MQTYFKTLSFKTLSLVILGSVAVSSIVSCSSNGYAPTNSTSVYKGNHSTQTGFSYKAQGNEPFWTVEVNEDNSLHFSTMDMPDGIRLTAQRSAFAKGVEYTGSYQNKPFALVLKGDTCEDTMADVSYSMIAIFDFNGQTYVGCADRN